MKVYCGTDIIEVSRIQKAVEETKGFKENIFSKNEIEEIDSVKCQMKYQRYAGRFAAKEALYKALSKILIENQFNISFLDVEIMNVTELLKRPKVVFLNENLKKLVEKLDIEIDISISHVKEMAVAMATVTMKKED